MDWSVDACWGGLVGGLGACRNVSLDRLPSFCHPALPPDTLKTASVLG